jgi:hypothetical protein
LSISEVLKQGVRAIRGELSRRAGPTPFEIYQQLDLGEGGYTGAPSTEVRRGVKEALERKHGK